MVNATGRGTGVSWVRGGRSVAMVALALCAGHAAAALPPVPTPTENPFSEAKRILGKALFFEDQMSTSNAVACASCHVMGRGGADPRGARNPGIDGVNNTPDDIIASPGVIKSDSVNDYLRDTVFQLRPQVTGRAANTPINAAYAPNLFWDGRANPTFSAPDSLLVQINTNGALESQIVQPILNTIEMSHAGQSWAGAAARLADARPLNLATNLPPDLAAALSGNITYPELFKAAFGTTEINATRIAFAIATYERTLISDQSPWDRFQAGDATALTPQQQQGLNEFTVRHCNDCHTAPHFTDFSFRNIGLRPIAEDSGRQGITGVLADRGKFKVPSLRNVGLKATFMHNGQFNAIPQVIGFYAAARGPNPPQFQDNLDPIIRNLVNVPPQVAPLIDDFIRNGLTDPRVANQQFPFDRPTLFREQAGRQPTVPANGNGVAGSGGVRPVTVVDAPAFVGNLEFRIGLDGALGGATARLGLSSAAPVNGVITPTRWFAPQITKGTGNGGGYATQQWPLAFGEVNANQVLYAQWFITDPGAAGGQAASQVQRIVFFCGRAGCPQQCGVADFNADGFVDFSDFDDFVAAFENGVEGADVNADGFLDFTDFDDFVAAFEQGC
ncbi:MAG: cytochrome c peroxidase [Planctomycetota bacterium]|nr:cytochrome c peroxidase [Planctomycetota bacterium]